MKNTMNYRELKMTGPELGKIPRFWSKKTHIYNQMLRLYKHGRASENELFWLLVLKGSATSNDVLLHEAKKIGIKDSLKFQVLGLAYNYIGQTGYALELLNKAVELDATVENLRSLAKGYKSLDDKAKARDVYMKIIDLDHFNFEANCFLAGYYLYEEDDEQKVGYHIGILRDKWIHKKEALYLIALFSYLTGEWESSIKLYKKYLRVSKDYSNCMVYEYVSDCYKELGDSINAIKYALKAVEIDGASELGLEILNQFNVNPESNRVWNRNTRTLGPANPLYKFLILIFILLAIDIHSFFILSNSKSPIAMSNEYIYAKLFFYVLYMFLYIKKIKQAVEVISIFLVANLILSGYMFFNYQFKLEILYILFAIILLIGLIDTRKNYIVNIQKIDRNFFKN